MDILNKNFKELKYISSGTSGIVYSAIDLKSNNKIILKFTNDVDEYKNAILIHKKNIYDSCIGFIPILGYKKLKNTIPITDYYTYKQVYIKYYIIYKYMNSNNLDSFLLDYPLKTIINYKQILLKISSILSCLLLNDFVYTDLKPENIFISFDTSSNKVNCIDNLDCMITKDIATLYLGDIGHLYTDNKLLLSRVSTFPPPTTKNKQIPVLHIMAWEFIVLCLIIHPILSDSDKNIIKRNLYWQNDSPLSPSDFIDILKKYNFSKNCLDYLFLYYNTFYNNKKLKKYTIKDVINVYNCIINFMTSVKLPKKRISTITYNFKKNSRKSSTK